MSDDVQISASLDSVCGDQGGHLDKYQDAILPVCIFPW